MRGVLLAILIAVPNALAIGAGTPAAKATLSASPRLQQAIPPGPMNAALTAFFEQTGVQNGSAGDPAVLVAGHASPGARAGTTPSEALRQLLDSDRTGVTYEVLGPRLIAIIAVPVPPPPPPPQPCDSCGCDAAECGPEQIQEVIVTYRRRPERERDVPQDTSVLTRRDLENSGIVDTADIAARLPGMQFYVLASVGAGLYTNLAGDGVTDRHGTVCEVFQDDIPIPEIRSNTFGLALPTTYDVDRVEVLRGPQGTIIGANTQGCAIRFVPTQPTLGIRSNGRNDGGVTGELGGQWAVTQWGNPSYEAGSWLDVPLTTGQLGFRLSGWIHSDGGYVDRVDATRCSVDQPSGTASGCPVVDANSDRVTARSFRGILTWQNATGSLRISPALSYVANAPHDSSAFFTYLSPDPGAGTFNNGSPSAQPADDTFYLATLKLAWDLGATTLNSVSAYFDRSGSLVVDDTESIGWGGWGNPADPGYLGPEYPFSPDNAVTTAVRLSQHQFSQEVRLGSKDVQPEILGSTPADQETHPDALTWFVAAQYARMSYVEADRVFGEFGAAFDYAPLDARDTTTAVQDHWALFGDATQGLGRHFALNAGVRVERESYDAHDTGLSGAPPYPDEPAVHDAARSTLVIPKAALTYQVEHHQDGGDWNYLAYLSAAKGYSPAGVDAALPTCNQGPTPYPTDTLWSYELGGKGSFALPGGRSSGTLEANLAAFQTRWDNGPTAEFSCLFVHMPGRAVSNGFNLDTHLNLPNHGFRADASLSYTDSHYTQTLTQTLTDRNGNVSVEDVVRAGDTVGTAPLVTSPWNLRVALEQKVALQAATLAFRAEDLFASRNPGPFHPPFGYIDAMGFEEHAETFGPDPSTNLLNLRAEVMVGHFTGTVFLDNALGSQPALLQRNKGEHQGTLDYATTFRPRTVGIAAQWHFD